MIVCVYHLSFKQCIAMVEHDWEEIGSTVSEFEL